MNFNLSLRTALVLSFLGFTTASSAQSASAPALMPGAAVVAADDAGSVVARDSSGAIVTRADLLSELQRAPVDVRRSVAKKPQALQQLANNLMVRRLLAREALRDAVDKNPVVQAGMAIASERVLSDAQLLRLDAQNEPSASVLDSHARQAYQAGSDQFEVPAQTRASHILLPDTGPESLEKAKALLAKLRAGASFEELAKTESTDAGSAVKGGDLGFFPAGKMVRPFDDAVNALAKPGDLSEPVKSQFGYHIIRLDERKAKSRLTYEEVKPQLLAEARTALLGRARVEKVGSLVKGISFDSAALQAMANSAQP